MEVLQFDTINNTNLSRFGYDKRYYIDEQGIIYD